MSTIAHPRVAIPTSTEPRAYRRRRKLSRTRAASAWPNIEQDVEPLLPGPTPGHGVARGDMGVAQVFQRVGGRSPNRHLGFGHGIHFCLGAALAFSIVLQTLDGTIWGRASLRCPPASATCPHATVWAPTGYRAFMDACRTLGAFEVLGPGNAGHDTHLHCAWS